MSQLRRLLMANQTREYTGYPLVISRSVALRYLKQYQMYGNSEQRNIPAEYQELESITFPSGAYIKTGIIPKTYDYEVGFKGAFSILTDGPNCAWGFMGASGNLPRWLCAAYSSNYLLNANATTSFGDADTNTHTFVGRVYDKNSTYYWSSELDGVIQQNDQILSSAPSWKANTLEIYVGARNNQKVAGNYGSITANHWWCKKAGVMIADYIPAKRNSDNEVGMYDTVSGQFFTNAGTGTFTAGPVLPTPENPVEVISVGDKTVNLFDGGERGTYVSTSGIKVDNNGKYRSKNKIPVVAGKTYSNNVIDKPSWFTVTSLNIFGYDAQGEFIWARTSSADAWSVGGTFTMPENTAYITISTFGAVVNTDERVAELNEKFVIVEGSVAPTSYVPYGYQIPVVAQGKDLFDSTPYKTGYYIDASGNEIIATQYQDEYLIRQARVQPSTQYTVSWKGVIGGYTQRIHAYDAAGNWLSQVAANSTTTPGVVSSESFTTPANCAYIRQDGRTQTEYQLEEGSTATPYAPYSAPTTTPIYLNAPLRKVGDYADVLDYKKGQIIRNVGVKVFTGTENWQYQGTNTNLFSYQTGTNAVYPSTAICTHYIGVISSTTTSGIQNGRCKYGYAGSEDKMYIRDNTYDNDLAGFKTYLAEQYANGTPVTIYYPLKTPVVESIVAPALPTMAGSTTYTTETVVKPSNMKGVF